VREVPAPGAVRGTSYFLISYPHTARNGKRNDTGSEREPDHWVIKFYKDLCRNVEELAEVPAGIRPGVLDRDFWVEDDWVEGLPEALATCSVLVPLYSSRYFQSEACGKEWYAFADRVASQGTQPAQTPAIVPVMWSPITPDSVHETARAVPIKYHGLDSYTQCGLDGIIMQAKYRADYDKVVRGVAQEIVAVAKRSAAGPWPVVDFGSLPSAFAPEAAPEPGAARLLITVVAPHRGDLPPGRNDEQYYGTAAWDWAPYWAPHMPAAQQPIAKFTANFARSLGYRPYVGELCGRKEDLLADGPAAHPELLIIDPWSVLRPECQRLLVRFNLADKPWVKVVIPWNSADGETTASESRLRQALETALRHKLEHGRATSAIAVEGVPSLDHFGAVLPLLIPAAGKRYLGNAEAFPPDGPVVEKPTLHGFMPNHLERSGGA
jgi:FxsC-like protein